MEHNHTVAAMSLPALVETYNSLVADYAPAGFATVDNFKSKDAALRRLEKAARAASVQVRYDGTNALIVDMMRQDGAPEGETSQASGDDQAASDDQAATDAPNAPEGWDVAGGPTDEGDAPEGDAPEGDAPEGDAPEGDAPADATLVVNPDHPFVAATLAMDGDAPEGDQPASDKPEGDAPADAIEALIASLPNASPETIAALRAAQEASKPKEPGPADAIADLLAKMGGKMSPEAVAALQLAQQRASGAPKSRAEHVIEDGPYPYGDGRGAAQRSGFTYASQGWLDGNERGYILRELYRAARNIYASLWDKKGISYAAARNDRVVQQEIRNRAIATVRKANKPGAVSQMEALGYR